MENGRIWEGFKPITLVLFFALYIASGTGYGLFHQHQSFVSHSTEEENDACHRAIYHIEKENACKHESHISKNERCSDCHLICYPDQIIVRSLFVQSVKADSVIEVVSIFPHFEDIFLYHPSRGPPRA